MFNRFICEYKQYLSLDEIRKSECAFKWKLLASIPVLCGIIYYAVESGFLNVWVQCVDDWSVTIHLKYSSF